MSARASAAIAAGAAALTLGAHAGPAAGAVRIDRDRVVVTSATGRAVVERSPFRLRVEDRRGRVVLASVGRARDAGGVRYAPLGLSTGDEPELRYPVLTGAPDPNPAHPVAPARFVARSVLTARRAGRAARLELATDDPAGRRLLVTVGAGPAGVLRIAVSGSPAAGVSALSAAFRSPPGEALHGFGGRRESTDLRGRSFQDWVLDYRFPDPSTAYYYPQSLFYSSHGYGLFLDRSELARWRLGSDLPGAWRVAVRGDRLDLLIAPQRGPAAIRTLTRITGREPPPPRFAVGPRLSRATMVGRSPDDYRRQVLDDVAHLERDHLPVTTYAFEGWAQLPRDLVRSVVARLRRIGIHSQLYMRSFVSNDSAGTDPPGVYDEALAKGYVARTADGRPYLAPSPFPGAQMAVIDFTNPAARAWWRRRVFALLDTGADAFMNDFGEQVLPGMRFADGETGVTMHNRYPALQHRVTREAVRAYERAHPRRGRIYFFVRAGYAGIPASARYEGGVFPGDEESNFRASGGLPSIVPNMLNLAVGGAYGFDTDIPGYADFWVEGADRHVVIRSPPKELFVRWSEAAALMPFFRVHNSPLTGPRMPWDYDSETLADWTAMARLHVRAEPLLRRLWLTARRTGIPITRPLWLADPGLRAGRHGDDEWLLGRDLLVAPVLAEGARRRPVALPRGCWRLHGRGQPLRGRRAVTVAAPLGSLPWLSRCGTRPLGRGPGAGVS